MGLLINLAVFKNGCEVERVICANDEKIIFFVFVTWNSDVLHTYYMLFWYPLPELLSTKTEQMLLAGLEKIYGARSHIFL